MRVFRLGVLEAGRCGLFHLLQVSSEAWGLPTRWMACANGLCRTRFEMHCGNRYSYPTACGAASRTASFAPKGAGLKSDYFKAERLSTVHFKFPNSVMASSISFEGASACLPLPVPAGGSAFSYSATIASSSLTRRRERLRLRAKRGKAAALW